MTNQRILKSTRKQAGLSQEQAASIMPCSLSCWQKWEQNINPMPPYALKMFLLEIDRHPTLQLTGKTK